MSIIEQAARRLEELKRSGIASGDPAEGTPLRDRLRSVSEGTPIAAESPAEPEARRIELDLHRLASAGILTPDAPRSRLADEFRIIKRPLIANAAKKDLPTREKRNLIMVTSALPGEGKTFTALNLAMSIAMELDHTVLLVDADVARPSLPSVLGVPLGQGLLDVLVDERLSVSDVLLRTNVEKLSILPSGTRHARATELLASVGLKQLLDEMARRYSERIIIFDSPPLLLTTEAQVLATQMGQIVMVVQAEGAAQADVKHALATIDTCPVKLLVLNKARARERNAYGYGYGYGYESDVKH